MTSRRDVSGQETEPHLLQIRDIKLLSHPTKKTSRGHWEQEKEPYTPVWAHFYVFPSSQSDYSKYFAIKQCAFPFWCYGGICECWIWLTKTVAGVIWLFWLCCFFFLCKSHYVAQAINVFLVWLLVHCEWDYFPPPLNTSVVFYQGAVIYILCSTAYSFFIY